MPINVTDENFKQEVEQSSLPVILDIFATWCGPCQQMEPIFAQLEKELSGKYKFAKLNVDQSREIAIKFGVSSVPTFLFLKDGKVVSKEIGYMSKADLQAKITEKLG